MNETLIERPPIVAILGHIDHGKSTLLDYIRKSNVVEREVGGITQNMSAYEIEHNGKKITFLDTPGHEAFQELRLRGTKVADIGILVVSAEDGVKTQTVEALKAILHAKIPYIVAMNKIDKEGADIERTKQSLLENEIYVEGYGGSIPCVPISAKTGKGIAELLDTLQLVSEMEEIKADSSKNAGGIILETNRDKNKGIMATCIITDGTLKTGMFVVSGVSLAPVRVFEDSTNKPIKEATFSTPVRVVGFDNLPIVGETFSSYQNKKDAEVAVLQNAADIREGKTASQSIPILQTTAYVPVVIKANTSGVIEAIIHEIKKFETENLKAKIVSSGVGDISENDIKLAAGSEKTIVVGFGNKVDALARAQAEKTGVEVKTFDIIYKLAEWLEVAMKERSPRIEIEEEKGKAKILKLFSITKDRQILGARLEEGFITTGDEVKIYRRESEIGKGKVKELQQGKLKTGEIKENCEFGTMIESKIKIAPGDYIKPIAIVVK